MLYNYIIKELYKLQPEMFVAQFAKLLHLKEDTEGLRKPYALDNTYYYETNLSYVSIFSNLRTILEKMELADELYVKFRGRIQTLPAEEAEKEPSEADETFGEKNFKQLCIEKVENKLGVKLLKKSQSVYKTPDGHKGFYFATSKIYPDNRGEKYWFGYRKPELLEDCAECYYVFGCKNEQTVAILSQKELDEKAWQMNYSADENTGEIRHWHVVFIKRNDGRLVWSLSKPDMHEEDITRKQI